MTRRTVRFVDERAVAVEETAFPTPDPEEVRVETLASGISPGTELLVYRGDAPAGMAADTHIDALSGTLEFPLTYGYAAVGRVTATGGEVDDDWLDRRVFAFRPHQSHFTAPPADLHPVPEACPTDRAALLPNAETAVNFAMDGAPTVGERVAVFGQGVVGLLTTAVLASFPLESLVTVDYHERRRTASRSLGADAAVDAGREDVAGAVREAAGGEIDLAVEVSGNPDALDDALAATGFGGRVLIGSWYGRRADLDLGGRFHRSRIRMESSQVSTIDPERRGRWTKDRRLDVAWQRLQRLDHSVLVTHRVPVEEAAEAYRLLDRNPETAIQVLLTY